MRTPAHLLRQFNGPCTGHDFRQYVRLPFGSGGGGTCGSTVRRMLITLDGLTKRFGATVAVDGLDLEVRPGRVTGFLGPNGAGKSTTLRMILGLDRPTSGRALLDGRPYSAYEFPLRKVGALLEAKGVHPGRTGRSHLRAMARSNAIPAVRVDEVLAQAGLTGVAAKRAGTWSLGMGQRLGIAGALLGDPPVLILDEPVNGLDPDGVRWIRGLMRELAGQGRTVLVSSHLLSEMQVTADHLIVIGNGRLLADAPLDRILAGHASLEDAYYALTEGSALR